MGIHFQILEQSNAVHHQVLDHGKFGEGLEGDGVRQGVHKSTAGLPDSPLMIMLQAPQISS
mgnify:CR=1 FL=1